MNGADKANIIYWANENLQSYFAENNKYMGPDMDIIIPDPDTEETRPLPALREWPKDVTVLDSEEPADIVALSRRVYDIRDRFAWLYFYNEKIQSRYAQTGILLVAGEVLKAPELTEYSPWGNVYYPVRPWQENIEDIAWIVYQDVSKANVIYWGNPVLHDSFAEHNDFRIPQDAQIVIPDPATAAEALPKPVPEWPKTYNTMPEDTIESIAEAFYDDATKGNIIFWANANLQAHFTENREYVGPYMSITIPDPDTDAQPLPPFPEWPKSYRTLASDSIERLSEMFYGVSTKGNIIYWENRNLQEYFAAHNTYVGPNLDITIPDPETDAPPLPEPLPEWPKHYDTKENENIWDISERFYGVDKANIIFWANEAVLLPHFYETGEYMKPNTQITIPDPETTAADLPPLWPRTYVTKPGDTIYSVSYDFYGTGDRANVIYWNNPILHEYFRKNNKYLDDNYATITIPDPSATSDPLPPNWPKYWLTKPGETIWSVAYDYYSKVVSGDPTAKANIIYWNNPVLQEYHRISMTQYLGPDKYIMIPDPSATSDPLPPHWPKSYFTQSSDNIWKIAYDFYAGDTDKANIIFWNNNELIQHHASTGQYVKPGIWITIPDISSTSAPLPWPGA